VHAGLEAGYRTSTAECGLGISFRASSLLTSGTHTPAHWGKLLHSGVRPARQPVNIGLCLGFGWGT